jgi:preprotein translocase subunit SecG
MGTILLVVYITAAISMIVLILLQRSEGGALGIGGGGGGLVSGRGAANFMTRTTGILATIFFLAAIGLGMLGHRAQPSSAVVGAPAKAPAGESTPASEPAPMEQAPSNLPALKLPKLKPETAPVQSSSPAVPAPATPAMPQLPQSQ